MTATNPEAPPLRVAVIGYSFMGRIHTQAWLTAGRFFDLGTRVEVAAVCGRDFVIPDDIKRLAVPLLRHRIVMTPTSDIEGVTADHALRDIIDQTAAPR